MQEKQTVIDKANSWARQSVMLKLAIIGVLILLLLIPASMLDGLIWERQRLRDSAQQEVAGKWGLEQTIGGPVISVPYEYNVKDANGYLTSRTGYAHFLPEAVDYSGQLSPEERQRGIFVVVLYNTELTVSGTFDAFDAAALDVPATALNWEKARFTVGIADMTGVNAQLDLRLGGEEYRLGPGTITDDIFASGASAPIDLSGEEENLAFRFDMNLNGSSALYFRPFGRTTTASIAGGWGNPSFTGGYLPKERQVGSSDFQAEWEVLELNRNYPQQGTGKFLPVIDQYASTMSYSRYEVEAAAGTDLQDRFGVRLLLPVDEYKKTYRSTQFAVLFIFITFLTFFFIEVLNKRRVHPIQYLLIGAAIILFYVLLLSISEHIQFNVAYWISCVAIVLLITAYSWFVLRNATLTKLVAAMLMVCYVFFYSLLQLQDFALLIGSIGLFLILATIMYLTRNVDWYNLGREERPPVN